jgi:malate dehydrogenase (oxaloacetate-decarboxylating)(NADP+)
MLREKAMDEDTPVKRGKEMQSDRDQLSQAALFYHEYPRPGKLQISATKPLGNQRDLALAYSPGVAAPARRSKKIR